MKQVIKEIDGLGQYYMIVKSNSNSAYAEVTKICITWV